jgi:hypothetical protein
MESEMNAFANECLGAACGALMEAGREGGSLPKDKEGVEVIRFSCFVHFSDQQKRLFFDLCTSLGAQMLLPLLIRLLFVEGSQTLLLRQLCVAKCSSS